jgi:DNA-binding transcriptional ArsR family regulator
MVRPRAASSSGRRHALQELRALAHPLRLRMLELFAGEPRTTMQVAALMGEPPTRLYHHVNALERAGILKLRSKRQVRGTTEKYYVLALHQLGVAKAGDLTPGSRAAVRGVAMAILDEARAELLASLANPRGLSKATAPIWLRMVVRVPASQQSRARRHMRAMIKTIRRDLKHCADPDAPRWALTLGFAPTGVKRVKK